MNLFVALFSLRPLVYCESAPTFRRNERIGLIVLISINTLYQNVCTERNFYDMANIGNNSKYSLEVNPGISWAGLHRATFEFELFQSFATADEEVYAGKLFITAMSSSCCCFRTSR